MRIADKKALGSEAVSIYWLSWFGPTARRFKIRCIDVTNNVLPYRYSH